MEENSRALQAERVKLSQYYRHWTAIFGEAGFPSSHPEVLILEMYFGPGSEQGRITYTMSAADTHVKIIEHLDDGNSQSSSEEFEEHMRCRPSSRQSLSSSHGRCTSRLRKL